jgi:hypothetical protein
MNKLKACIVSEFYAINKKFVSVLNEIKFRSLVNAENISIKRKYRNIGRLIYLHQGEVPCDFSGIDREIAVSQNRIEKARKRLSMSPRGRSIKNGCAIYKDYPMKNKIELEQNKCSELHFRSDKKTIVAVGKYKNNKKDLRIEDNLNTFFD